MDAIRIVTERIGKNKIKAVAMRNDEVLFSDQLNPAKFSDREQFVERLATKLPALKENTTELDRIDGELLRAARAGGDTLDQDTSTCGPDPEKLLAEMPQDVRQAAETMLQDPQLIGRIIEDVAALGLAGEHELAATIYLTGTSRLLDKPLAAIVQGHTSSGKSYVIQRVASLFPQESITNATQMTPQALYHMPPGTLEHRFIVAGERAHAQNDETADTTKALREIISEGWLVKQVPEKVDGQGFVTVEKRIVGPIAYVESTTLTRIFEEDANRCLLLATDETEAQTRRVLETMARGFSGGLDKQDRQRIIDKHHAAQRIIRPSQVMIPYASGLAENFPAKRPEARRAYSHLLGLISASALLHSRQRQSDLEGQIIATLEDYTLAKRLLDGPLARLLGLKVSDAAMRTLERLRKWVSEGPFTTHDVITHESLSDRAVRGHLSELYRAGYVDLVERSRGPKPSQWRLTGKSADEVGRANLPEPSMIMGSEFRHADKGQLLA